MLPVDFFSELFYNIRKTFIEMMPYMRSYIISALENKDSSSLTGPSALRAGAVELKHSPD